MHIFVTPAASIVAVQGARLSRPTHAAHWRFCWSIPFQHHPTLRRAGCKRGGRWAPRLVRVRLSGLRDCVWAFGCEAAALLERHLWHVPSLGNRGKVAVAVPFFGTPWQCPCSGEAVKPCVFVHLKVKISQCSRASQSQNLSVLAGARGARRARRSCRPCGRSLLPRRARRARSEPTRPP